MSQITERSVRNVTESDLMSIAAIRCKSFADSNSLITRLGVNSTYRYLKWLLEDIESSHFICVELDDKVVGYGILAESGVIKLNDYLRKDWSIVGLNLLRKPHLLLDNSFISRTNIIRQFLRPKKKRAQEQPKKKRKTCGLIDTAVDPNFRRRGIGTTLLLARERIARENGYEAIICSVEESNTASIKMHEDYGYVVSERNNKMVKMEKDLT